MEELLKQFMGQMDKRFDQIDARFDKIELDIKSLTEEIRNNQTENRSYFKHVEAKPEQQQAFRGVAEEIKGIKIDINYLNQKIAKHDMEINNLHQRL